MFKKLKFFLIKKLQRLLKDSFDALALEITELKIQTNGQEAAFEEKLKAVHVELKAKDEQIKKQVEKIFNYIEYSPKNFFIKQNLKKLPMASYKQFENKFRGPVQLIKNRQNFFIQYFLKCTNVIDLGCGRGEFLELLKENKIRATGIDSNCEMINICGSKKLDIVENDIFNYLIKANDFEFDGIFCSQVIEHLNFNQLQNLIYLLSKKVQKNSPIIIETPNPYCPDAIRHFHLDPTHINPIFPEVLTFTGEFYGMKQKLFILSSPVSDELDINSTDFFRRELYGDYAVLFIA